VGHTLPPEVILEERKMSSDLSLQFLFDMGIPQKAGKFRKESPNMTHYRSSSATIRSNQSAIFLERIVSSLRNDCPASERLDPAPCKS
jgi:hypothetical protein